MRVIRIAASSIVGLIAIALILAATSALWKLENLSYSAPYWTYPYAPPVVIDGDDWFINNGSGFSGDGTIDDPYLMELQFVSMFDPFRNPGNITTAFDIRNTSVHLEIRDCAANMLDCAVRLTNVRNCSINGIYSRGYLAPQQIVLENCSTCQVTRCEIDGANCVQLYDCRDVQITGNSLYGSSSVVELWNCEQVRVYHNDFLEYFGIFVSDFYGNDNTWDDGYPSGGNFWQGINPTDKKSGENQDRHGSDGIGDSPYIGNVTDRYPLVESYTQRAQTKILKEADERVPQAMLGTLILIPLLIALLPGLRRAQVWTASSLIFAVGATALCWPTVIDRSMSTYHFLGLSLPRLEIAIFACAAASVALFLKARDWSVRLSLLQFLAIGTVSGLAVLSISIWSGIWSDLPWMGGGWIFVAHTLILFIGAYSLAWLICARNSISKLKILKDSVEVDPRALLFVFVLTSFGLVASVYGYDLTPSDQGQLGELARSVLLNALPGIALTALAVVSLRSIRAEMRQKLPSAVAVLLLLMLVFIYVTIVKYLAWRYST